MKLSTNMFIIIATNHAPLPFIESYADQVHVHVNGLLYSMYIKWIIELKVQYI